MCVFLMFAYFGAYALANLCTCVCMSCLSSVCVSHYVENIVIVDSIGYMLDNYHLWNSDLYTSLDCGIMKLYYTNFFWVKRMCGCLNISTNFSWKKIQSNLPPIQILITNLCNVVTPNSSPLLFPWSNHFMRYWVTIGNERNLFLNFTYTIHLASIKLKISSRRM